MRALWLIGSLALLAAGCEQSEFPITTPPYKDPEIVTDDTNIQCTDDSQCGQFETCINGLCQLKGCGAEVAANPPPLGTRHYLALHRDLLVAQDATLNAYEPTDNGFRQPDGEKTSWSAGGNMQDITGGNLLGTRPEAIAIALENSQTINVVGPGAKVALSLSFKPIAIAAGDADGDGMDELVAFGAGGQISLCYPKAKTCKQASGFDHAWTGIDVAFGDIDGDLVDEPVFLAKDGDKLFLFAWNVKKTSKDTQTLVKGELTQPLAHVTTGDLNGDGTAEVIGHHDGGTFQKDILYTYSLAGGKAEPLNAGLQVDGDTSDVASSDTDGDHKAEVAVLFNGNTVQMVHGGANVGSLQSMYEAQLASTSGASRISLFDMDGDSPAGRLIDGPRLVSGEMLPIAVLTFPPYSETHSDGIAGVSLGSGSSSSAGTSKTVSLGLGVNASFTLGLGKLFGIGVSVTPSISLSRDISRTTSESQGYSVGSSFSLGYNPEDYGSEYAGVVVSCGCFAAYTYQVDDPGSISGGNGEKFTVFSPVGGQTTVWTSKRYNAMAAALGGNLPQINVKHKMGVPSSYPTSLTDLNQNPIGASDLVFPNPPTYRVADVGQVGWSLSADESTTNSTSMSTSVTLGLAFSFDVFGTGVGVGGSVTRGWSTGESVTVGKSISFSGHVPALPDKPTTPEDEYLAYGYAFTPYVYRQHYTDASGKKGAYYVLMYMVRE